MIQAYVRVRSDVEVGLSYADGRDTAALARLSSVEWRVLGTYCTRCIWTNT